jgi:hypothetical protein
MAADGKFSVICAADVTKACVELAASGQSVGGGSYFVEFDGRELPAKRVLRTAYRIATGREIGAGEFSGGTYTARVLEALGFKVVVRSTASSAVKP